MSTLIHTVRKNYDNRVSVKGITDSVCSVSSVLSHKLKRERERERDIRKILATNCKERNIRKERWSIWSSRKRMEIVKEDIPALTFAIRERDGDVQM